MYAQTLQDFDLGQTLEQIGGDIVKSAEEAVSGTAQTLVKTGQTAAEGGVKNLIESITGTGSSSPATQTAETPVATQRTTTSGSFLSGLPGWVLPAGAGIGVYFWQKSFLWAGITAIGVWFLASKMGKGGKA